MRKFSTRLLPLRLFVQYTRVYGENIFGKNHFVHIELSMHCATRGYILLCKSAPQQKIDLIENKVLEYSLEMLQRAVLRGK